MSQNTILNKNLALSGCKIEIKDGKVLKSSTTKEYNERLLKQIEKQSFFSKNFNIDNINTPHIYSINNKGFTSFLMEKSDGLGWKDFFENCSVPNILNLELILTNYINFFKTNAKFIDITSQVHQKLKSLLKKSKHKKLIKNLLKKQKIICPISFCHGDLSFLNLLFDNEEIVLIDFLDSFVESYYIDLIKLRQDLQFNFCLEMAGDKSIRIKNIFDKINEYLNSKYKQDIKTKTFQILEIINYLRIEPYIDPKKAYILDKILDKIEYEG